MSQVEMMIPNGFRITRSTSSPQAAGEHVFQVTHCPDGAESSVAVGIDPEAVERVTRLSRRQLEPGGAFWQSQAERLLAAFLWSEGKMPEAGRLTVRDVSREDLDLVSAWTLD